MVKFGVAGLPKDFYNEHNHSYEAPKYLHELNLDAFEYQCSRSLKVSDKTINELKNEADKYNIDLSIHAPYYISLSTNEEVKQKNTINYIIETMKIAKKMSAKRIVVHAGSLIGQTREVATQNACNLLKKVFIEVDRLNLGDVTICLETMGKINQLGTSEEIIEMCKVDNRLIPTIDFGHLYSRTLGKLDTYEIWKNELQKYIDALGYDRMKNFHSHFSKMVFTPNGGEKMHTNFKDNLGGPDYKNVLKAIHDLNLNPIIICESSGDQEKDAVTMKKYLKEIN